MTDTTGRGAWSKRGFPYSGTMYRRNVWSSVATGGEPDKDLDHLAVHYGVLAIQKLLAERVALDYSSGPGIFGPRTDAASREFQKVYVPPADGIVGPNTMRALLKPVVSRSEGGWAIPGHYIWGIVGQESAYDPGAVGYSTPTDFGLVQINISVNTSQLEQAFDPVYAVQWASKRMADYHAEFKSLYRCTDAVAWDAAIASHNAPSWGHTWAKNGEAPNSTIAGYVASVKRLALLW